MLKAHICWPFISTQKEGGTLLHAFELVGKVLKAHICWPFISTQKEGGTLLHAFELVGKVPNKGYSYIAGHIIR